MAERRGCFQDIRFFVACYGILFLTDIMAGVMKRSSLTTLERRFDLPSATVALIASSFQIGNMTMLLIVSYFGSRWHRPRTIFWGSILLIIGNVIVTLPQFIGGRYEYEDVMSNVSSSTTQVGECADNSTVPEVNCEEKEPSNQLYIVIIIGMIINGIGGTPHQPLGLSYIDDFAHESNSPLYLGLTHVIALLGPMAGYFLSALFLSIWVDIGWVNLADITIKSTHPSWVGAWWLGVLVCTSGIAIALIPFFFFPKKMKKQEIKKKGKKSEEPDSVLLTDSEIKTESLVVKEKDLKEKELKQSTLSKEKKEIWNTLKRVFSNPIYLLILGKFCFTYGSFAGIYTFFPKYLEVHFGVSASRANMITGMNVPFLITGILIGSVLLKRFNFSPPGMVKLIAFASISATMFMIPLMLFGCDTIDIAGVTVPYAESPETVLPNYSSGCNNDCGCSEGTYAPVCGSDGISYISPCHAGCTDTEVNELGYKQTFTDCSCVKSSPTNASDKAVWAKPERCEFSKCPNLVIPAVGLKAAASFFAGIGSTPMYIFLIRSVAPQDKAFAIGVYLMSVRILALPMPLVYGSAIDSTCLYWGQKACSNRAYCKVYDNAEFRLNFYGIMVICQVLGIVTVVILYFVTKNKYKKSQEKNNEETKNNTKDDEHNGTVHKSSYEEKLIQQKENEVETSV